jgi:hypothetical protein
MWPNFQNVLDIYCPFKVLHFMMMKKYKSIFSVCSNISIQKSLDKFLEFSSWFSSFFDETNVINIERKMIRWLNNIRVTIP